MQKPHPPLIRAIASENSLKQMAQQGRPFMLSMQPLDQIRRMFDLYRGTMSDAGFSDDALARATGSCWIWFNGVVAETDAKGGGNCASGIRSQHAAHNGRSRKDEHRLRANRGRRDLRETRTPALKMTLCTARRKR